MPRSGFVLVLLMAAACSKERAARQLLEGQGDLCVPVATPSLLSLTAALAAKPGQPAMADDFVPQYEYVTVQEGPNSALVAFTTPAVMLRRTTYLTLTVNQVLEIVLKDNKADGLALNVRTEPGTPPYLTRTSVSAVLSERRPEKERPFSISSGP